MNPRINISKLGFAAILFSAILAVLLSTAAISLASTNLISNPSFEIVDPNNPNLPLGWSTGYINPGDAVTYTYPVTNAPVSDISNGIAASISVSSISAGNDAKWYFTPVPIVGGRQYIFSDSYISNVTTDLVAEFLDSSSTHISYSFASEPPTSGASTWAMASNVFTAPTGAAFMTVYHRITTNGSLTLDSYSLTEVPPPSPFPHGFVSLTFDDGYADQYASAKPVLDAAGFKGTFYVISHFTQGFSIANSTLLSSDQNDPTKPAYWTHAQNPNAVFTYPVAGSRSGISAVEVSASTTGSNAGWYFNPINVYPDKIYDFSDSYRGSGQSSIVAQVTTTGGIVENADVVDTNGNSLGSSIDLGATTTWSLAQGNFYIPVNAKTVTIIHKLTGVGTLDTDDTKFGVLGTMNDSQIFNLVSDGQEIGGHTQTHPALTTLSTSDSTAEISGGRNDLLNGGLAQVTTLAYPYGDYNQVIESITANAGFTSARTIAPGFNGISSDKFALLSQSVDANTTLAQVQGWIDQAKNTNTWLILVFHDIESNLANAPYGTTPAELQAIVDYLKASQVPVLTMNQGIAQMGGPVIINPTVNVSVSVQNTHGGTSTPSDFLVTINAQNPHPTAFTGSTTPQTVSMSPGSYLATTTIPENYVLVSSVGCAGSISSGQTADCTIVVADKLIILNNIPPVIAPHADISAEATSPAGATVTYNLPAVTDTYDTNLLATCSPSSGNAFSLGSSTVTCNATDSYGNHATSTSFSVVVRDTTAPVITLKGSAQLTITLHSSYTDQGTSVSDAVDRNVIVVPTGSVDTGHVGTYILKYDATDASGNRAIELSRSVNVVDTIAPTIAAHSDVISEATSANGATVSFDLPSAQDSSGNSLTVSCSPLSRSLFALGTTTVGCSAANLSGISASTTFNVIIRDTTPPMITVPADVSLETATGSARVTFASSTANDIVDGPITSTCDRASGDFFDHPSTTVTCTAIDTHGNSASASFKVILTTAPVVTLSPASETLPPALVGSTYSTSFTATSSNTNDSFIWITPSLPAGLSWAVDGGAATISGTPTEAGSSDISISVNGSDLLSSVALGKYLLLVTAPPIIPSGGGGGGAPISSYSATGSHAYSILDFNQMVINWGKLGQFLPGDLNHDGVVDILDFNVLVMNWQN